MSTIRYTQLVFTIRCIYEFKNLCLSVEICVINCLQILYRQPWHCLQDDSILYLECQTLWMLECSLCYPYLEKKRIWEWLFQYAERVSTAKAYLNGSKLFFILRVYWCLKNQFLHLVGMTRSAVNIICREGVGSALLQAMEIWGKQESTLQCCQKGCILLLCTAKHNARSYQTGVSYISNTL